MQPVHCCARSCLYSVPVRRNCSERDTCHWRHTSQNVVLVIQICVFLSSIYIIIAILWSAMSLSLSQRIVWEAISMFPFSFFSWLRPFCEKTNVCYIIVGFFKAENGLLGRTCDLNR